MHRIVPFVLVLCAACTSSTTASTDAGSTYVGCNGDTRVNLTGWPTDIAAPDGTLRLHFVSGTPSVPLANDNTWTLAVQDSAGLPLDVSSLSAYAFMPDHGHPSLEKPAFTHLPDGTWQVSSINFSMPGVWRVTFTVTRKDGTKVDIEVFACAAG